MRLGTHSGAYHSGMQSGMFALMWGCGDRDGRRRAVAFGCRLREEMTLLQRHMLRVTGSGHVDGMMLYGKAGVGYTLCSISSARLGGRLLV